MSIDRPSWIFTGAGAEITHIWPGPGVAARVGFSHKSDFLRRYT